MSESGPAPVKRLAGGVPGSAFEFATRRMLPYVTLMGSSCGQLTIGKALPFSLAAGLDRLLVPSAGHWRRGGHSERWRWPDLNASVLNGACIESRATVRPENAASRAVLAKAP